MVWIRMQMAMMQPTRPAVTNRSPNPRNGWATGCGVAGIVAAAAHSMSCCSNRGREMSTDAPNAPSLLLLQGRPDADRHARRDE